TLGECGKVSKISPKTSHRRLIINDRKILYTINAEDLNPLIPCHFLISDVLTVLLHTNLLNINSNRSLSINPANVTAFLAAMAKTQRHKCRNSSSETIARKKSMVIRDGNLSLLQWRFGRIVELHPGADGIIRHNHSTHSGQNSKNNNDFVTFVNREQPTHNEIHRATNSKLAI
ncbi:unnamed protein product, partial [Heterotrigona itama]